MIDTTEARAMLRKVLPVKATFSARYRRRTGQWCVTVRQPEQPARHFTGTRESEALAKAAAALTP